MNYEESGTESTDRIGNPAGAGVRTEHEGPFVKPAVPGELSEEAVYEKLYTLAQRDYRTFQVRGFFRKSASFFVYILSALGIASALFYFFFLKDHIIRLREEISQYNERVAELNTELKKVSDAELQYREQAEQYRYMLDNLEVEDNRIIDFNMADAVRRNTDAIQTAGIDHRNIIRGNTDFREIALTFDLGTGEDLPLVYSTLKRFNVKATVFLSNEMASTTYGSLFRERNLKYLSMLGELGCEFGNHTWSHYNLTRSLYETSRKKRLSLSFISDDVLDELHFMMELNRVKHRFEAETGYTLSSLWRAPYGAVDDRVLSLASKAGYTEHILWSSNPVGPLDFFDYVRRRTVTVYNKKNRSYERVRNPYYFSSSEMLQRFKTWEKTDANGMNGAIAIAHLGTARKHDKMVKILPELISHFQSRDYHFLTVSQVINDKQDY